MRYSLLSLATVALLAAASAAVAKPSSGYSHRHHRIMRSFPPLPKLESPVLWHQRWIDSAFDPAVMPALPHEPLGAFDLGSDRQLRFRFMRRLRPAPTITFQMPF